MSKNKKMQKVASKYEAYVKFSDDGERQQVIVYGSKANILTSLARAFRKDKKVLELFKEAIDFFEFGERMDSDPKEMLNDLLEKIESKLGKDDND